MTAGLEKGSSTSHSDQPRPRMPTMWPPPVLSWYPQTNTVVGSKRGVAAIATDATLGAVRVQTRKWVGNGSLRVTVQSSNTVEARYSNRSRADSAKGKLGESRGQRCDPREKENKCEMAKRVPGTHGPTRSPRLRSTKSPSLRPRFAKQTEAAIPASVPNLNKTKLLQLRRLHCQLH